MVIKNKVKELKTVDVDTFLSWEFNTLKDSNKRDTTKLENAIIKSGWSFPVIKWHNFVIDGTGRKQAVKNLLAKGYTIKEIPYVEIEADNLEDAKAKALEVSSQFGEITKESFLEFTKDMELDFDTFEIDGFGKDTFIESEDEDDEVPVTPEAPRSVLGDLYELGGHRVLCGDSTSLEAVERLMGDSHSEMLFTSPPYADMREYNGGKDLSVDNLSNFITTFAPFCEHQVINLGIKRDKHEIVSYWDEYINKAKMNEYKFLAWNVWAKSSAGSVGNQSAFIPITHEWIFVFGRTFKDINRIEKRKTEIKKTRIERAVRQADGSMSVSSVGKQGYLKEMESVYFSNPELGAIRKLHPATFPVELADKYIRSITNEMDNVVDPFTGSGTTLIACEKSHRRFFGMELDPKYVDVIVQRYVDYTGNENIKLNGKDIIWKKTEKNL